MSIASLEREVKSVIGTSFNHDRFKDYVAKRTEELNSGEKIREVTPLWTAVTNVMEANRYSIANNVHGSEKPFQDLRYNALDSKQLQSINKEAGVVNTPYQQALNFLGRYIELQRKY